MARIIVFIAFVNAFMLLVSVEITDEVKDFEKSFMINLKCCVAVIKQFKSLIMLRLMFIALKAHSCSIFSDIKMYNSLNLIVDEELKFT